MPGRVVDYVCVYVSGDVAAPRISARLDSHISFAGDVGAISHTQGNLALLLFLRSRSEWHLGRVQQELHQTKTSRKGRQPLRTQAALITAGEGAELCRQQEQAREAAEAKKAEDQRRKAEEEKARHAERERIVRDTRVVFSGALSRKVKDELKDIAFALGLPMDGRTNTELCELITTHLAAQASRYAADPKFAGLYTTANGLLSAQKRPLPADLADENVPPPPSRRRLHHSPAPSTSSLPPCANSRVDPLLPSLHTVPALCATPHDIPIDPVLLNSDQQTRYIHPDTCTRDPGPTQASPSAIDRPPLRDIPPPAMYM